MALPSRLILSLAAEDACGMAYLAGGLLALCQQDLLRRVHVALATGNGNVVLAHLAHAAVQCAASEPTTSNSLTHDPTTSNPAHTPWASLVDASAETWRSSFLEPLLQWCETNHEYQIHAGRGCCWPEWSAPWAHGLARVLDEDCEWERVVRGWHSTPYLCFVASHEESSQTLCLTTDTNCPTASNLDTRFARAAQTDVHGFVAASLGLGDKEDALQPAAVLCELASHADPSAVLVSGCKNTDTLGAAAARIYFMKERMGVLPSGAVEEEVKVPEREASEKWLLLDAFTDSPAFSMHTATWTQFHTRQMAQEALAAADEHHETLRCFRRGIASMYTARTPLLEDEPATSQLFASVAATGSSPLTGANRTLLQHCVNWGFWRVWHTYARESVHKALALERAPFPELKDPMGLCDFLFPRAGV